MINILALRSGTQGRTENARLSVRHVQVPEDRPVIVYLVVATDEEQEFKLGIGDTFPVRDDTWTFDRIEKPATGDDQYVILRKVEPRTAED